MPTFSSQPENQLDNDKDINSIDERIKTQFGLALASEPTEDGKKAIERFYYGFLNNYPGYDYVAEKLTQSKLKAFAGEVEEAIGDDEPEPQIPVNDYYWRFRNELRAKQRKSLKAIKEKYINPQKEES